MRVMHKGDIEIKGLMIELRYDEQMGPIFCVSLPGEMALSVRRSQDTDRQQVLGNTAYSVLRGEFWKWSFSRKVIFPDMVRPAQHEAWLGVWDRHMFRTLKSMCRGILILPPSPPRERVILLFWYGFYCGTTERHDGK